jgi:hypothetical protein
MLNVYVGVHQFFLVSSFIILQFAFVFRTSSQVEIKKAYR